MKKDNQKKEKTKTIKKTKLSKRKVLIALIITGAIIYILYAAILLNKNKKTTVLVEQGTIQQEETVIGYIIRNEKVIKNEEFQNGIIQISAEGEKVYKNEAIFQYYSDEAKQLANQITSFDLQIQEKLKTERITSNSDIKLIEAQIEEKLEELKKLNNIQEITEYNKTIKKLLERKISTLGSINGATSELKKLINQREKIDNQIRNSTKYLTAPISGIVSYRVDGLEEELTIDNFDKFKTEYLESLKLKTGQIIPTSGDSGKVIDNFTYYIATTMTSKEAMEARVGKNVTIRLSTNDEIEAKIQHIIEEDDKRVIILKIDRMIEKLINYRKISFDVVWWKYSGLKISNQAIQKDEKGLSYLVRTNSGYLTKLLVKITNKNEKYSIITTYTTEELSNLGFTQEQISDYRKVKLYDEILLEPTLENIE